MLRSYLIDIGDHWSFHHRFDASTLYRKPRKDQCLNHLQKDKVRKLGFNENKYKVFQKKKKNHNIIKLTSGPSSASPAMQP